jgi:hypothetical protein
VRIIPGGDVLNRQGSYIVKTTGAVHGWAREEWGEKARPQRIPTIFIRDGDIMIKRRVNAP